MLLLLVSLVPRPLGGGEKRAWYLLFAHARKYPLLNTCSGKSGRGMRILIHVIDIVTYKFILIVACSEELRFSLQLVTALHHASY